jgi:hypothetical protein
MIQEERVARRFHEEEQRAHKEQEKLLRDDRKCKAAVRERRGARQDEGCQEERAKRKTRNTARRGSAHTAMGYRLLR